MILKIINRKLYATTAAVPIICSPDPLQTLLVGSAYVLAPGVTTWDAIYRPLLKHKLIPYLQDNGYAVPKALEIASETGFVPLLGILRKYIKERWISHDSPNL